MKKFICIATLLILSSCSEKDSQLTKINAKDIIFKESEEGINHLTEKKWNDELQFSKDTWDLSRTSTGYIPSKPFREGKTK